jgi:hypothetical protein
VKKFSDTFIPWDHPPPNCLLFFILEKDAWFAISIRYGITHCVGGRGEGWVIGRALEYVNIYGTERKKEAGSRARDVTEH